MINNKLELVSHFVSLIDIINVNLEFYIVDTNSFHELLKKREKKIVEKILGNFVEIRWSKCGS